MLRDEERQKVLAKLTNARNELEDALNISMPRGHYAPVTYADATRKELSVIVDDLNRLIQELQEFQ